jgi:hypothetical protein
MMLTQLQKRKITVHFTQKSGIGWLGRQRWCHTKNFEIRNEKFTRLWRHSKYWCRSMTACWRSCQRITHLTDDKEITMAVTRNAANEPEGAENWLWHWEDSPESQTLKIKKHFKRLFVTYSNRSCQHRGRYVSQNVEGPRSERSALQQREIKMFFKKNQRFST